MRENNGMYWTELSWAVVQGCTKVSPGCFRCMAEQSIGSKWCWRKSGGKPFAVKLCWDRILGPRISRRGRRILVVPHGDMFHREVPFWFFRQVLIVMRDTPKHTYFLLTKRPSRMKAFLELAAAEGLWPLPNTNIGVSAENQEWYDKRMPILASIPVHELAYRYVVCEPLLGPINLGVWGYYLGWLVYGQERSSDRREWDRAWGDDLVKQCKEVYHIPYYRHRSFKQWKLQIVQQKQPQEEDEMEKKPEIKLLTEMPKNGTPCLIIDPALMGQLVGIEAGGVAILFTSNGTTKPAVVEDTPRLPCKESAKRELKMDRNDLQQLLEKDFGGVVEMSKKMGMTTSTLGRILEGETLTALTVKKVERFLTSHFGTPTTFAGATIRDYPGQG